MGQVLWVFAIFVIGSVIMTVAFLVAWAKNFAETRQFMPAGLAIVGAFLILDVTLLWLVGLEAVDWSPAAGIGIEIMTAIRLYTYTVVGLLLSQRLNDASVDTGRLTGYGLSTPTGRSLSYALLATVIMLVFSVVLFSLTTPAIGAAFDSPEALSAEVSLAALLAVVAIAFSEEIVFRLGLQNGLTYLWRGLRYGHYWAVLVTSAFWSVAHIGSLQPDWVKFVQVFAFGLILGQMNRRFGVLPCIVTHVLFNVTMVVVSAELIRHGVITVGSTP
ncbi:MAG: CPBP family intramembrane metalloprotease [Woeseiaceae bacterium]|nr:CPBP family intramembrane metalloprotease [Woeseiaceae bacterium]